MSPARVNSRRTAGPSISIPWYLPIDTPKSSRSSSNFAFNRLFTQVRPILESSYSFFAFWWLFFCSTRSSSNVFCLAYMTSKLLKLDFKLTALYWICPYFKLVIAVFSFQCCCQVGLLCFYFAVCCDRIPHSLKALPFQTKLKILQLSFFGIE